MSHDSYVQAHLPGSPGGPLLFVFHGTGGDENQLVALGRDLMPEATIVAPRGDVSEHGAARFFRRTGEGVYDMDDLTRATMKMVAYIREHRSASQASQVFGLGYSNGANILASTLFSAPALFDAVVMMHPLIPFAPRIDGDLSKTRILVTAGRRDPICPPGLTLQLANVLSNNSEEVLVDWHDGGHELRPKEIEAARSFLRRPAAQGS